MNRWSGQLRAYDEQNRPHIVTASGANYSHAAARLFRKNPQFKSAETLQGHKRFDPPPQRNGFSLGDCMQAPASQQERPPPKASRDKAVIGVDIDGATQRALREGHPRLQVAPDHLKSQPHTQFEKLLTICDRLPDPFTVDDVLARLVLDGHGVTTSRQRMNVLIQSGCKKGAFVNIERGVFKLKESEYFVPKVEKAPPPKLVKAPEPPPPPPAAPAIVEVRAEPIPVTVPTEGRTQTGIARLSPLERAESLLAMAATALMVTDSDRGILERAMEASQALIAAQRASDEANLAVVDLLERMLGTVAVRSVFSTAMRATSNDAKSG